MDAAFSVAFDAVTLEKLRRDADSRHATMRDSDLAYGISTPARQFAGVLGEAAVLMWINQALPNVDLWGDQRGGADVYVRNPADGQGLTLIEVKTHSLAFWRENGRLVNARQLARMSADLIVWCVLEEPLGQRVVIAGWAPVAEVRASGVPEMTGQAANVRVHAPLRTPGQLIDWVSAGRSGGWPDAAM